MKRSYTRCSHAFFANLKKRRALILLVLILCSFVVISAKDNVTSEFDVENVKTEFGAIRGTIEGDTKDIFAREIEVSSGFLKLFFGENTSVAKLALLIGIWVVLFVIIRGVLEFTPLFDNDKMKFFASIIVTFLIVMTGVIDNLSTLYLHFLDGISWFGTSTIARIIFGIIFFFPLVFAIKAVFNFVLDKLDLEKAKVTGENINVASQVGKVEGESLDKNSMVTPIRK